MYEKHPLGILGKQNYKWKPLAENKPNTYYTTYKEKKWKWKGQILWKDKTCITWQALYGHHQVKEQGA